MTSIAISDLLTIIFVLVDDCYQEHGPKPLAGKPGAKPEFSDTEVITLMLAQDYIPYRSETQDIGFLRANCTGHNIERLLTKTVLGLCTRVIRKITSPLLRHLLFFDFSVNVQTFEIVGD